MWRSARLPNRTLAQPCHNSVLGLAAGRVPTGLRSLAWIIPFTASFAVAHVPRRIDCRHNPALCEIEIGSLTLTLVLEYSNEDRQLPQT
jgi:hypothetical protein